MFNTRIKLSSPLTFEVLFDIGHTESFFCLTRSLKIYTANTKNLIMNALKNSVQLIGNLGKDIEFKTFDNGTQLARFTIATNEYYKNNKGEKVQETQWHNVVSWGKLAETMSKILEKGNEVLLRGKLVHRSYEDKDGNTKYASEVVVNEFLKLTKNVEAEMPF